MCPNAQSHCCSFTELVRQLYTTDTHCESLSILRKQFEIHKFNTRMRDNSCMFWQPPLLIFIFCILKTYRTFPHSVHSPSVYSLFFFNLSGAVQNSKKQSLPPSLAMHKCTVTGYENFKPLFHFMCFVIQGFSIHFVQKYHLSNFPE